MDSFKAIFEEFTEFIDECGDVIQSFQYRIKNLQEHVTEDELKEVEVWLNDIRTKE